MCPSSCYLRLQVKYKPNIFLPELGTLRSYDRLLESKPAQDGESYMVRQF